MNIWDSHVHLFTQAMAEDPCHWADSRRELVWKACVAPPDRPSIQGWSTVARLLNDMDQAHIEKAVLLGWYWENQETCQLHNRFYADLIQLHPDRLLAFAAVQPTSGAAALSELAWARDFGFSGIGEIHPQAQGFRLKDGCWEKILQHIQNWNFPINLHVTDPHTPSHPGKVETPLNDYVDMARRWPNQSFILAHLGGLIPLTAETGYQRLTLHNLFFDCAATPLLYEASILRQVAKVIGDNRLLFGSDYPLRAFPGQQKTPGFKGMVRYVQESGLTEDQLHRVFSSNAKRLFTV